MKTKTDTPPIPSLIARVCHACGIEAPSVGRVRILRSDLSDRELIYGTCEACNIDPEALSAAVLAELLDVPPGDDVLRGLWPQRFADRPEASPDRPNRSPWAHINRAELADEVAARRRDIKRRTSETPCHYCGVNVTPRGRWRRTNGTGGSRSICGACHDQIGSSRDTRDRTAAIIAGLTNGSVTRIPHNLADHVGLLWWGESGRTKPNRSPFAHLDIPAIRRTVKDLADRRVIGPLPNWWDPDQPVKW